MTLSLERIKKNEVTVGVIGLGYAGLPAALTFAEAGVKVIGFDVNQQRVDDINRGKSYIHHIDDARIRALQATADFSRVAECDALIICVPTSLDHHFNPDLTHITAACEEIAPYLKPHTLVSLESSSWPGTTEEVVWPLLEARSKLKVGKDLYLCFSPEREDPGNKVYSPGNIPKLVGAVNKESLELAVALYGLAVEKVVPLSSSRVAEATKLVENTFRSVNIAFVNELKVVFDAMGIDVWEVIRAAGTKPFGYMPFWPSPGAGGPCLPSNFHYLSWKADQYGLPMKLIQMAGDINESMPAYIVSKTEQCLQRFGKSLKGARILLLGMAYKADVDDTRGSISFELIKLLESHGAAVDYHDPYVDHVNGRKSVALSSNYDCFVMATAHQIFSEKELLSYHIPIIDTRHFLSDHERVFRA